MQIFNQFFNNLGTKSVEKGIPFIMKIQLISLKKKYASNKYCLDMKESN